MPAVYLKILNFPEVSREAELLNLQIPAGLILYNMLYSLIIENESSSCNK